MNQGIYYQKCKYCKKEIGYEKKFDWDKNKKPFHLDCKKKKGSE